MVRACAPLSQSTAVKRLPSTHFAFVRNSAPPLLCDKMSPDDQKGFVSYSLGSKPFRPRPSKISTHFDREYGPVPRPLNHTTPMFAARGGVTFPNLLDHQSLKALPYMPGGTSKLKFGPAKEIKFRPIDEGKVHPSIRCDEILQKKLCSPVLQSPPVAPRRSKEECKAIFDALRDDDTVSIGLGQMKIFSPIILLN